jgi:hypothetical protein
MPIPYEKRPVCPLAGEDGNAFSIIARVSKALKNAGFKAEAEEFKKKAMSSDYNNLLMTAMKYVREPDEVDTDDDEGYDDEDDYEDDYEEPLRVVDKGKPRGGNGYRIPK